MNFLHSRYRKSGKIKDDDLLYTLSTFALEPSKWINQYEWRSMTDLEMCACGTFWKNMGDAMEISYTKLSSSVKGWQDGLHWLNELKEWSDEYEKVHMVPADANKQLADAQIDNLLPKFPAKYRDPCKQMVVALLGDRLRQSMMLVKRIVHSLPTHQITGTRKRLLAVTILSRASSVFGNCCFAISPYLDPMSFEIIG